MSDEAGISMRKNSKQLRYDNARLINPLSKALSLFFLIALTTGLVACGDSGGAKTPTPTPNKAPTVTTLNMMVEEGNTVTLTANAADSDGQLSTYVWTQTSGTSVTLQDASSNAAQFIAPQTNEDLSLEFTIVVTDDDGATATAVLLVTVQDVDNSSATIIGAAGGMVTSSDGKVTLNIPAGALNEDVAINVRPRSNDVIPSEHLHADLSIANVYQFSPEGLQFSVPVRLTMPYDSVNEDGSIPMTWLVSGQGEGLDSEYELMENLEIDTENHTISADMQHFSIGFALFNVAYPIDIDIYKTQNSQSNDEVGGQGKFFIEYELVLDRSVATSNAGAGKLLLLHNFNISVLPTIGHDDSTAEVLHDLVAPSISVNHETMPLQTTTLGQFSGQCVKENPSASHYISYSVQIEFSSVADNTTELEKFSTLLANTTTLSHIGIGKLSVECRARQTPIDPVLTLMDASMKAIEGFAILQTFSLLKDLAISLTCPQVLISATNGTALFNPCTGEKLKSYLTESETEKANYQTAVLVAPEGEPQQLNIVQNKLLTGIDPETDQPYSFSKVLNFSLFGESGPFIDITLLGGDNSKGIVYVDGTSYLGVLAYNSQSDSFEKQVFVLQDSIKSAVANGEGNKVLVINTNNELVYYDLSGDNPVRTLMTNMGSDIRRMRCNFVSRICAVADFSLNLLKTFMWDGNTLPGDIVASQEVADGPVEMDIVGSEIAVAGYRDDVLSVLTTDSQGNIGSINNIDLPAGCSGVGHVGIIDNAYILSCNLSNSLLYLPKTE